MNRCDLLVLLTSKNVQKKTKGVYICHCISKIRKLDLCIDSSTTIDVNNTIFSKKNKKLIKPRTNIMSQNLVYAFAMTEKNETEAVNNVQKYQNIQPFCFTSPFKIPC